MILTCSSCSTRFLIDPAAVGPGGRNVRCAKCQHVWFQDAPADLPKSLASGPAEPANPPPPLSASTGQPAPLRRGANLPVIPKQTNRLANAAAWAALLAFVIAFVAGGYVYRDSVVGFWAPSGKLYTLLGIEVHTGSVRLADVAFEQIDRNGMAVLEVTGAVVNDGYTVLELPEIIVTLRDAQGNDIHQWRDRPAARSLPPGGRAEFATSMFDPPATARNLEVTLTGPKPDLP